MRPRKEGDEGSRLGGRIYRRDVVGVADVFLNQTIADLPSED